MKNSLKKYKIMSAISDVVAQKLAQIREQNKTVWDGYLYVWLNNEIQLVYISAYLQYLERIDFKEGYKWVYEKDLKEINRASLSDIEQNPQIAVVPRGGARPPQTKTLPTEKLPTNGVDLGGITFNAEKVIPYAIGFLLLFFLFVSIGNRANN